MQRTSRLTNSFLFCTHIQGVGVRLTGHSILLEGLRCPGHHRQTIRGCYRNGCQTLVRCHQSSPSGRSFAVRPRPPVPARPSQSALRAEDSIEPFAPRIEILLPGGFAIGVRWTSGGTVEPVPDRASRRAEGGFWTGRGLSLAIERSRFLVRRGRHSDAVALSAGTVPDACKPVRNRSIPEIPRWIGNRTRLRAGMGRRISESGIR